MVLGSSPSQHPDYPSEETGHLPEADAALAGVDEQAEMPLPSNLQTFFLGGLFALGTLAAIYVASSIILPVVLAFVLKLLLQPAVRVLERLHLPRAVGALLPILLVIGALAWARPWRGAAEATLEGPRVPAVGTPSASASAAAVPSSEPAASASVAPTLSAKPSLPAKRASSSTSTPTARSSTGGGRSPSWSSA